MWKFPENRINKINLRSDYFKSPIPLIFVKPKKENNDSCIFIFNSGLGGTNAITCFMDSFIFDNNWFVSYEKMSHGNNQNEPSQYKKKYLLELHEIIKWVKNTLPNHKIFLLGESWGAAINFVYLKKHYLDINGVINWNMPTKSIDIQKKKFSQSLEKMAKNMATILFNANCLSSSTKALNDKMSQNKLLVRTMSMALPTKLNTKLALAVWRFTKSSLRFLNKECNNSFYRFLYIQSAQDIFVDWKKIDKIESKADPLHFHKMNSGFHILSMEPVEHELLYKKISEYIKKF